MTLEMAHENAGEACSCSAVESALRWLAVRKDGEPPRFLRYAIEDPASESAAVLGCLVGPSASLPAGTIESRAFAVWGLVLTEIGKVGSAEGSRRRATLTAAFRLPPAPGVSTAWSSTLDSRFRQLLELPGIFGNPPPSTTTPMHKAWKRAVERLTACVEQGLAALERDGAGWPGYVEIGRLAAERVSSIRQDGRRRQLPRYRTPSRGAQPVFMERMVVGVVMHRRTAARRMTERVISACEDGVDGYDVHALTGWSADPGGIPVRAIWNCRLVASPGAHRGDPVLARLRFGTRLGKGEWYGFSSEAWDEDLDQERSWINVDVDHHGVAPGVVDERSGEPLAGLTIQITFDERCLPEACWWYAEEVDHERLRRPPDGDPRLLEVGNGFVRHTFSEPCHPREGYGIAFRWPRD